MFIISVQSMYTLGCSIIFFFLQKNEIKLEELLREVKSLRDLVTLQDRRIAKLEEQVAKVAVWGGATSLSQYFKRYILEGQLLPKMQFNVIIFLGVFFMTMTWSNIPI